jgi:hypothetical protein
MELKQQHNGRAVGGRVRDIIDSFEPRTQNRLPGIEEPSLAVLEPGEREIHQLPSLREMPHSTRRFIGLDQGFHQVNVIVENTGDSCGMQELGAVVMFPQDAV